MDLLLAFSYLYVYPPMNKQWIEDIVREFREHFGKDPRYEGVVYAQMSGWLRTVFTTAYNRGREDALKDIKGHTGFLRQWLNEDRITDPEKMVTNEDIESWLTPPKATSGPRCCEMCRIKRNLPSLSGLIECGNVRCNCHTIQAQHHATSDTV